MPLVRILGNGSLVHPRRALMEMQMPRDVEEAFYRVKGQDEWDLEVKFSPQEQD